MRYLILLMLTLCLAACSSTFSYKMDTIHPCEESVGKGTISSAPQWFNQGHTYRLRHGGTLQLMGKNLPLYGFMILGTQKKQAKDALLTGLDIKLATLEISESSFRVINSSPIADRIPHFMEQCAFAIQRMFLTHFPKKGEAYTTCGDSGAITRPKISSEQKIMIDLPSESVSGKSLEYPWAPSDVESWWVYYSGHVQVGDTVLPKNIFFTHENRDYKISLQLNGARIQ